MKLKFIFTLLLISTGFAALANPPAEEGKAIFNSRCASCHSISKTLTGPALAGLDERRSMDWIVSFVRSSQSMIKAGDKDAIAVFEKHNKIPMPDHTDLNAESIASIVEFIKTESKNTVGEKAPFAKPTQIRPNYVPLSIVADAGFFIGFFAVVILLVAALLFAVQLKQYERGKIEN